MAQNYITLYQRFVPFATPSRLFATKFPSLGTFSCIIRKVGAFLDYVL